MAGPKDFGYKKAWVENIWAPKKFWSQRNHKSKKNVGLKNRISCSKTIYVKKNVTKWTTQHQGGTRPIFWDKTETEK